MNQRSDITHDRFTQKSGEFLRVYGWQRNEDGNDEPVMVIYRTAYPTHVPFGVSLRTAYRFVDSKHLMACAFRALDHFGMLDPRQRDQTRDGDPGRAGRLARHAAEADHGRHPARRAGRDHHGQRKGARSVGVANG